MNYIKEGVVWQEIVAPMITDSNHACFTKMSGCGFQEGVLKKRGLNNTYEVWRLVCVRAC